MMIKKNTIIFILILSSCIFSSAFAQSERSDILQVAFIDSKELFELVPGKDAATKLIEELNAKYKDELVLMQNDYNSKYTDFLSNQNTLAESIKLRRMQELYELEQSINRFMKIAQEDIESQEDQLIKPLKAKLDYAIEEVGLEQGFVCIYDKSNPTVVFLTPAAVDANHLVKQKLQKR